MFDFRLKVFYTVAKRLNFTKAAEELCITQPAVSKHIQEIELHYGVRLFERYGSRIRLSKAGELLYGYCHRIFGLYNSLAFEMSGMSEKSRGQLRIGASTTIAQYLLPPVLAEFHRKYPDIKTTLSIDNTEQIERALKNDDIDFGIVEGQTQNNAFRYRDFVRDELVLVVAEKNPNITGLTLSMDALKRLPLLLREPGSGTLEVLVHALRQHNIRLSELTIEMQLGSTESIKTYLLHSACAAFLSIHSILTELKHNNVRIIDVEGLNMERMFRFIQRHGEPEGLPERFISFALQYNYR